MKTKNKTVPEEMFGPLESAIKLVRVLEAAKQKDIDVLKTSYRMKLRIQNLGPNIDKFVNSVEKLLTEEAKNVRREIKRQAEYDKKLSKKRKMVEARKARNVEIRDDWYFRLKNNQIVRGTREEKPFDIYALMDQMSEEYGLDPQHIYEISKSQSYATREEQFHEGSLSEHEYRNWKPM